MLLFVIDVCYSERTSNGLRGANADSSLPQRQVWDALSNSISGAWTECVDSLPVWQGSMNPVRGHWI